MWVKKVLVCWEAVNKEDDGARVITLPPGSTNFALLLCILDTVAPD
jgi:hypothetical protein